jgi:hypothetical protein
MQSFFGHFPASEFFNSHLISTTDALGDNSLLLETGGNLLSQHSLSEFAPPHFNGPAKRARMVLIWS